jgi:ABC-2 type transport system ATP-binding protein
VLLQDQKRLEVQASGVPLEGDLRRELEEVLARHGGKLESFGHPTTTLEELFLRIVAKAKEAPGRRYLPAIERGPDGQPAATAIQEKDTAVRGD